MTKPQSLYIHIPFCNYICSYCDFPKLQYFSLFASSYLKALKNEIDNYHIDHNLNTIYVGGGTPTSLNLDELKELLEIIKPYTQNVKEYTFEVNPDSLTKDKLILLHQYGVNRLSIGVESTSNHILASINRHHTYEDVIRLIKEARDIGFNNINVDIILGLTDDIKDVERDINNILLLNVEHISCYSLTVHEHTKFSIDNKQELDDDKARLFYDLVTKKLEQAGYIHYEISNYAKKDRYSLHNYTYWRNERYYGVGLGASGYINNYRYTNTRNLTQYLKGNYIDFKEDISTKDNKEYFIMNNLRTIEGIDLDKYEELFIERLENKKKVEIDNFLSSGLLILEDNHLRPTYEGMMILDQIILKLFD